MRRLKPHLQEKRIELVWALDTQGYNTQEIGDLFNLNRSVIYKMIQKRPSDYKPKWIKVQQ